MKLIKLNSTFVHNHSSSPSWPALAQGLHFGPKKPGPFGPEEAPTRHDQAPEVTVETQLALARTSTLARQWKRS